MSDSKPVDREALAELLRLLEFEPQPLSRTTSVRHDSDGCTFLLDADGVEIGSVPTEDYREWLAYAAR